MGELVFASCRSRSATPKTSYATDHFDVSRRLAAGRTRRAAGRGS
jgi:hypothetical protein